MALAELIEGNSRYVSGERRSRFVPGERLRTAAQQTPSAVVIGCADSRVPVEVVFDAGVGELFVVRSAGHVISEAGFVSMRYAIEKLGCELVVVLGHEDCGAVKAAMDGEAPRWLRPITDHIRIKPGATMDEAVDSHVRESVAEIREWLDDLGYPSNKPVVVGGAYELGSGKVHWLD
jgi:carbonic anhydrase